MIQQNNIGFEQVAVQRLIDNAAEYFENSLMAINGRIVLWGSFEDSNQLSKRYLSRQVKVQPSVHRTKTDQAAYKSTLTQAAEDAASYRDWAKQHGTQPILRECLVSYCTALENFLKALAIAFNIASSGANVLGFNKLIFIPGTEFRNATKLIKDAWEKRLESRTDIRAEIFHNAHIYGKHPISCGYVVESIDKEIWKICAAAFQIRNAIVHGMARHHERIELGEYQFEAGQGIDLEANHLQHIQRAFKTFLSPFQEQLVI